MGAPNDSHIVGPGNHWLDRSAYSDTANLTFGNAAPGVVLVLKLQKHFGDVNEDVRQILISADKIEKRAGRIEELDFSKSDAPVEAPALRQERRARAVSRAAQAAGGGVDLEEVGSSGARLA